MFAQPDYYGERDKNTMNAILQAFQIGGSLAPKRKTEIEKLTEVLALQAKTTQAEQDARRSAMLGISGGGMAQPPMGASAPMVATPNFQQMASLQGAGAGGGLIPTGANLNTITGDLSYSFGKDKAADKRAEDQYSQEKQLSGTGRFMQQFGRSYSELKKSYPEIGDEGYLGSGTRLLAKINANAGKHPETIAFLRELEPIANQMARDVEGGKITDKDREIYAKSFANAISAPEGTNARLFSNTLLKMRDKGGNIDPVVNELRSSDLGIFKSVVKQIDEDEFRKLKATIGRK